MTQDREQLLSAYARLVVRGGANVQLEQRVVIRCVVEHAEVARAVAAEAYRVGASHVSIQYDDPHVQRAAVEHAPDEALGRSLAHELEAVRSWAGCHVAWGAGFPVAFDGARPLDPQARVEAGLNQAGTHVDIVVGSPAVEVDGLDAAGVATPIIRGDEFSLT
jgi:leucyl aminopeptidase (aminopeptidase T)